MKRAEEKVRHSVPLRKGDMVRVMKGRDREAFRNKSARVLSVDAVKMVVTVEHAQMIKRHTRPNPAKNIKGGIVEREGPISIGKVMLVCPACNKPSRIGYTHLPDGSKMRICRRCHSTVDNSFQTAQIPPGNIGRRLDGWPNRDLNVGAIVNLSPDLSAPAKLLGVDQPTVRKVLQSWGPGKSAKSWATPPALHARETAVTGSWK